MSIQPPEPILPCPFCGQAPALTRAHDVVFTIHCANEDCDVGCETSAKSALAVVRAWNTRAPSADQQWPEVTPEQVAKIDKLVAPEFATGDWQTVECEQPANQQSGGK